MMGNYFNRVQLVCSLQAFVVRLMIGEWLGLRKQCDARAMRESSLW